MGKSLFDIASLMGQFGSSGNMIKVLLLLDYASIARPKTASSLCLREVASCRRSWAV